METKQINKSEYTDEELKFISPVEITAIFKRTPDFWRMQIKLGSLAGFISEGASRVSYYSNIKSVREFIERSVARAKRKPNGECVGVITNDLSIKRKTLYS